MHICFPFTGDSVGGSHISTLTLANGLIKLGHKVTIVIHKPGILQRELEALQLPYRILGIDQNIGQTAGLLEYLSDVKGNFVRIYRFLAEITPDIVHTNDMRIHLFWTTPARLRGVATVWHQRTYFTSSLIARYMMLVASHTIVISNATLQTLPSHDRADISLISNPVTLVKPDIKAIDLARKTIVEKVISNLETKQLIVLGCFGNLRPLKNPQMFVNLIAYLVHDLGHNVVGAMFGKDENFQKHELEVLAKNEGISGHLIFMGFLRPVEAYMAACNILIAPSKGDAFGRTLIEAMALRVPVVASDAGGHKEIIRHHVNGLLVESNDVKDYGEYVDRLIKDAELREQLVTEGIKTVQRRYTLSVHLQEVTSVYRKLI
jgi:glycosyltransferase involved in cell wall biosynthesis